MQLTQFVIASAAILATASAKKFPQPVSQQGILNLQNYINNVINDIVQSKTDVIGNDYSSTGRSLAFLAQNVIPGKGCPQVTTGKVANTSSEAIADLQNVQLTLSNLSLDVINDNYAKGKKDICLATAQYGDVANYVQLVRTPKA